MKLHADSIHKYYGQLSVLSGAYLACEVGQVVGLLGRNGCGKSTLLKAISQTIVSEGTFVEVGATYLDRVGKLPGRLAYLPQDAFMPSHLRVREAVRLYVAAEHRAWLREHAWIKPYWKAKAHQVSGGELRLIEALLVLYSRATFVLLDEPFNGLAPLYKEELMGLIREQAQHKGVVLTDHDYRNVLAVANRWVVVRDGYTYALESVEELREYGYLPDSAWG